MLRFIKYTLCMMFMLPFVAGCTGDEYRGVVPDDAGGELPIEFRFALPDALDAHGAQWGSATRAFDSDVKTSFANGDVIHVLGDFKIRKLQEDGSYQDDNLKRYGALSFDGKNWIPVPGSNLTWPATAVSGTFTAYYIYGSDGVLTDATESTTYLLSSITPTTDPLTASTPESESVIYGHAVQLDFTHVCSYLTLIDLEPQVASSYWFKRDEVNTFNNAFKLVLKKDSEGEPESLQVEFSRVPDPKFNNLVYIAANAIETTISDDSGIEKKITHANYFLEPGLYKTFSLCYQAGEDTTYDYLQYDYDKIPENVGGVEVKNIEPDLKAGVTYTLTITKSPGITITSPPSGEGWDESDTYVDVDVEEFLRSVNNKTSYTDSDGNQILEATANGTRLLRNVDFHNFKYSDFQDADFVPNNMEDSVFDGDYHYIKNLGSPLFRYNYGTIQNLGIKDVKISETSYEDPNTNKDMSRYGALCMWNRAAATINNVRVSDVDMTITVKSDINVGDDGSETHNIGCVIGSNTGHVSEVYLSGAFKLHVKGDASHEVNSSVLIGGFVGQNAAEGNIYDVSPLEGTLSVQIINECSGSIGSYSIGGVVGESSGIITGVIISNITIDSSQSSGVTSYIGGIAGQLAVSEETAETASIESCIVSGSVTAGTTVKYGEITSASYIGGIAGADLDVPVIDCRSSVSVKGSENVNDNVIYAAGGALGRIRSAGTSVENIIAYGATLAGPHESGKKQYVGNFAGIVPKGLTWAADYADKNILVRSFADNQPIGGALDGSNNE